MTLDRHFKQRPMFGCSDRMCCGVYPPEDTDHCPECMVEWPCEVELLRQRAERAEAERDEWHESHTHWRTEFKSMRARAERAEAQCVALRNEVDSADRRAEQWETEARQFCQNADYWRERAERAEQACRDGMEDLAREALRAERAEAEHLNQVRLNLNMDAALARVRALCDEWDDRWCRNEDFGKAIRAAIDGGAE